MGGYRVLDKSKEHDSVMNSLDWSLENSTGMTWLEIAKTKQYDVISKAVWELVHGVYEEGVEDD